MLVLVGKLLQGHVGGIYRKVSLEMGTSSAIISSLTIIFRPFFYHHTTFVLNCYGGRVLMKEL
jgi:hypothetical protein